MRLKNQQDFFAGLIFIGVGVAFAWAATSFEIGSAAQMGPGYFPLLLGILISVLGIVVTLQSIVIEIDGGGRIGGWAWRPLFFVIAANLVFGVMLGGLPSVNLPSSGLVVSVYAVTLVASLAGDEFKLKEVFTLATVLAIISYLTCVVLLKLQFQVWPAVVTG